MEGSVKKLHIISSRNGDIRPRCATDDEILEIADGLVEHAGHLLASVTINDDGDIVATPLTMSQIEEVEAIRGGRL
jgi:hypothetical protein